MKKVAFVGGKIFDSDNECFVDANVLCFGDTIERITNEAVDKDEYEIIDLDGKYLIPGLIDVHTHGLGGLDFNFASEDEIEKMIKIYAKEGTTSIMATLASDTYDNLKSSSVRINKLRNNPKDGHANIIGVHLEGRYLNPQAKGAHAEHLLAKPNANELEDLASCMMPLPIHASFAPEVEGGDEFIKKANELGITVGIAHTTATYEQALHALEIGARSFTHTYNAMTKMHHREPGATIASLTIDMAYSELIADGYHSHPALVKLAYKSKPSDKLVLITDSIALACTDEGFSSEVAGIGVTVKGGVAVNEFGVIAGSTLTMFKALTNFMKFCNIPLNEAIKYATTNPAKMIKAVGVGKIDTSYRSDFIVIKDIENPEIDTVYVGANEVK